MSLASSAAGPPAPPRQWARRWRGGRLRVRPVRLLTDLLVVVLFAGLLTAAVAVTTGRWAARPVLSGSMRPALSVGGIAVTQRVPTGGARVGDVLVLQLPGTRTLRVHRVVEIDHTARGLSVRTKGDANAVADPGALTLTGPWVYRVRWSVPLVGWPAVWLAQPFGATCAMAAGLIVALIAAHLWLRDRRRTARPGKPRAIATT